MAKQKVMKFGETGLQNNGTPMKDTEIFIIKTITFTILPAFNNARGAKCECYSESDEEMKEPFTKYTTSGVLVTNLYDMALKFGKEIAKDSFELNPPIMVEVVEKMSGSRRGATYLTFV